MAWNDRVWVRFTGDARPISQAEFASAIASQEAEADYYCEGGSSERMEQAFAAVLGKETAVFMPTGTLANHIGIRYHCRDQQRVAIPAESHVVKDSGDALQRLSGIRLMPLAAGEPGFLLEELTPLLDQQDDKVSRPLGAVSLELPVRRCLGRMLPFFEYERISKACRERDIAVHLDGARLFLAAACRGRAVSEYAALADTVYVSLYKYFDVPFGAILAGPGDLREWAQDERRTFGGGIFSNSLFAEQATQALASFSEEFTEAMKWGKRLWEDLRSHDQFSIRSFSDGTNIAVLECDAEVGEALVNHLRSRQIEIQPYRSDIGGLVLQINASLLSREYAATRQAFFDFFS